MGAVATCEGEGGAGRHGEFDKAFAMVGASLLAYDRLAFSSGAKKVQPPLAFDRLGRSIVYAILQVSLGAMLSKAFRCVVAMFLRVVAFLAQACASSLNALWLWRPFAP